jgi:hypothetical protein
MATLPPHELEQRAERAVRRGDLLVALDHYETLLADHPDDERIRSRIESVRSLLQPSELVHRRKSDPISESDAQKAPLSDAEAGELHASAGRFAEAVEAYRRAVARSPKNELLRERLQELTRLAPPGHRAVEDGLDHAEKLAPAPQTQPRLETVRSAKAADAVFRPLELTPPPVKPAAQAVQRTPAPRAPAKQAPPVPRRPAPLPADPVELLRALLTRVQGAGRRG